MSTTLNNIAQIFDLYLVRTRYQLNLANQFGLANKYCEIFAEPPYREKFSPPEVQDYFEKIRQSGGIILVGYDRGTKSIISFAASIPLSEKPAVVEVLGQPMNTQTACYFAEDAVIPERRRRGVSAQMKHTLIDFNRASGFETMILRTNDSPDNPQITAVQKLPGVRQIVGQNGKPLTQDVPSLRLNGETQTDRRCFFEIDLTNLAYGAP